MMGRKMGHEKETEKERKQGEWLGLNLTSSDVTCRCDVFLRFSIIAGLRLRSFRQPTRMIGRPGQKCLISEIHC
jgi:hypothetical protein